MLPLLGAALGGALVLALFLALTGGGDRAATQRAAVPTYTSTGNGFSRFVSRSRFISRFNLAGLCIRRNRLESLSVRTGNILSDFWNALTKSIHSLRATIKIFHIALPIFCL